MQATPTVEEYVGAMRTAQGYIDRTLTRQRAEIKRTTMFGPAGKAELRSNGERVIYGPNGAALARVVEDPDGGTQVEENDRLHAVVRPKQVRVLVSRSTGEVIQCP